TPVQRHTVPLALAGRDVIASAATGSGKTAAYLIPALAEMLANEKDDTASTPARPRCVVLVPTRELAHQVTLQAKRLCFKTGLKVATLHGGQSVKPQLEQLAQGPDVVVATPGRLLTCAKDEPYLDMSNVRTLVVDEADQMLDMGFEPQVREILIGGCGTPPPRQSLLFSATFPPNVQALAARLVMSPGLGSGLYGNIGGAAAANITQHLLLADHLRERKMELLVAVLRSRPLERRTLVFVAAKADAKWSSAIPDPTLFSADELHGDCSQGARTRALDAFATGAVRVLVATDVASRGLDLPDVTHVVNFDLPTDSRDFDAYVHRIGRTARAGKGGTSTS
ncbi:predicted protein, partial [Micromonas commoda]